MTMIEEVSLPSTALEILCLVEVNQIRRNVVFCGASDMFNCEKIISTLMHKFNAIAINNVVILLMGENERGYLSLESDRINVISGEDLIGLALEVLFYMAKFSTIKRTKLLNDSITLGFNVQSIWNQIRLFLLIEVVKFMVQGWDKTFITNYFVTYRLNL